MTLYCVELAVTACSTVTLCSEVGFHVRLSTLAAQLHQPARAHAHRQALNLAFAGSQPSHRIESCLQHHIP